MRLFALIEVLYYNNVVLTSIGELIHRRRVNSVVVIGTLNKIYKNFKCRIKLDVLLREEVPSTVLVRGGGKWNDLCVDGSGSVVAEETITDLKD